ncbi:lysozyme inhibitor LprI family protein [Serratia liquefaciens]|uniref:lysozyme inhibitor LprI family protein n=1 Tax=Serratia liquefaciens TaxID=614 RepID=UPI0021AED655|nr:lysozyme inhibitor LprI family protein [Serratia liquefaciens]
MKKAALLLIIAFTSLCAEASQSMCTSNVTKELEACAKENFEDSDKNLNLAYKDLAEKLSATDKGILVRAEKEWLAYKESTCQSAFDITFPGEEAGIDKWTCLDQITRARTEEIQYLNAGIGALGFYKALDVVPKLYEAGSRDKFISKLTDAYAKEDNKNWRAYVEDNCKLAVSRVHEDRFACIARQTFYRY